MSQRSALFPLRRRLRGLGLRRLAVGVGSRLASFAALCILTLGILFLLDWILDLSPLQRVITWIVAVASLALSGRSLLACLRRGGETLAELALIVEREHGIQSQIAPALEFEALPGATAESRELKEAAIEDARRATERVDVLHGFTWRPLLGRGALLGLISLAAAGLALSWPAHASIFFSRLVLGSGRYPTRTIIEIVEIDGVPVASGGAGGQAARPFGASLPLRVVLAGEPPRGVEVQVRGAGGSPGTLQLKGAPGSMVFEGGLERLCEAVELRVLAGDARTDPIRIETVPRPAVRTAWKATLPAEASSPGRALVVDLDPQNIVVPEGSSVELSLECLNKDLSAARFLVEGVEHPLVVAPGKRSAALPPTGTPLERLERSLAYEIHAIDSDGLGLERPLRGTIRVLPDEKPRVAAATLAQIVLPTARPSLTFGATDDFGVALVEARLQVTRSDGRVEERRQELYAGGASEAPRKVVRGKASLDLGALRLNKGDILSIVVEATDVRGGRERRVSLSEAIAVQVTDERGVLSAMADTDERTAKQLDLLIEQELGIRGSP